MPLSDNSAASCLHILVLSRLLWRTDEPAAVCSECGCTFGVGRSTLWPHDAGATGDALASGSAAGGFQDDLHPVLPVTVRHGCSLPGRQLSAGLRRRSSSAAFCQLEDVCHQQTLRFFSISLPVHRRQTALTFNVLSGWWIFASSGVDCWERGTPWLAVNCVFQVFSLTFAGASGVTRQ